MTIAMKWRLLILLIGFLLFASCKHPNENKESSTDQVPKEKIVRSNQAQHTSDSVYRTSTGKYFEVRTKLKGESLMDIMVSGKGFPQDMDTMRIQDADPLTGVFILDLNEDGFDEIYLVTTSAGSGSHAGIYGYSSNKDQSYSPIYIPEITENDLKDESLFARYMGHDSIFSSDGLLRRKFPVYKEGDPNCCPTGGFRTLTYTLYPGEAMWQLKLN